MKNFKTKIFQRFRSYSRHELDCGGGGGVKGKKDVLVGSRYKNTLKIKEVQLYIFPLDK